ncbi:hypothetical protein BOW51_12465 [Solemya velesiana gill symbiont]|uniref:Thiamine pyrophosphate enzyme central domain-containing protein n=1 Tax=Solemya velesiana gill symbiont TaxID=1918948 RepID=A0A1T2KLZ4_9GAMM|nr:hypothetical protein BOW51_12465 [Solemya velesiana gill symbiont]
MEEAFWLAREGLPGPVLIDLPKDIQLQQLPEGLPLVHTPEPSENDIKVPSWEAIEQARAMMQESRRPLIYAGGGVTHAGALDAFRIFAETCGIPSVFTLKGIGNLPAAQRIPSTWACWVCTARLPPIG